jgi:glycosyltransferase involved in cell wall biosynthesis
MPSKTVSCIIAAYNEEKGIGTVLSAVAGHPLITEVIVVDDCSHDHTSDIVRQFPNVKLIRHAVNKGKTLSVADAIEAATGEFICSLDADLIGITAGSVTRLIRPVVEGAAEISISYRENAPWFYFPLVSITFPASASIRARYLRNIWMNSGICQSSALKFS